MTAHRLSRNGQPQKTPTPAAIDERNEIDRRLDHLNQLWNSVEKKLLTMQPPRHISVEYHTEYFDEGEIAVFHCLGIQRSAGKWRLCHGTYDSRKDPEQTAWKPITECNIETRIKAAKFINALEYEVAQTGKTFIPELDEAISTLQTALWADL